MSLKQIVNLTIKEYWTANSIGHVAAIPTRNTDGICAHGNYKYPNRFQKLKTLIYVANIIITIRIIYKIIKL